MTEPEDEKVKRRREAARAWKRRNRDKVREARRRYYLENRERELSEARAWRARNGDRLAVYVARHRGYVRDWQAKRKAERTGKVAMFDPATVRSDYGSRCWACGSTDSLCMDHIIPLSIGGSNFAHNLRLLCASCNARKGSRLDHEVKDQGLRQSLLMGHEAMEVCHG